MTPLPHHYRVGSDAQPDGIVGLTSEGLPSLHAAAPAEFDGPGDQWSPESMLLAAVLSCFQLSFRAIAGASKLSWTSLHCDADGTLDQSGGATRFVKIDLRARLVVPADVDEGKSRRLLQKAEKTCFITNSLNVEVSLDTEVERSAG